MFKWIIGLLLVLSVLQSATLKMDNRIVIGGEKDGIRTVRIYLNYKDPFKKVARLQSSNGTFDLDLPLPSRWILSSAKIHLNYLSSLALRPERSILSVGINGKTLHQLILNKERGIDKTADFTLRPMLFEEYNKVSIRAIQHYLIDESMCENEAAPELWTEVDLETSYLELQIFEAIIPEKISSIGGYIIDDKNIFSGKVHFALTDISDKALGWNAFIAGILGKIQKFSMLDISSGSNVRDDMDNIIIAKRTKAVELLKPFFKGDIEATRRKLKGNINIITNPRNPAKAFIVITSDTDDGLKNAVYSFATIDFNIYSGQFLNIQGVKIPKASKPYSAPNFIPTEQKILFKELGYKTTTFQGVYPTPLSLYFKVYPDYYFSSKDDIITNLTLIYPDMVRFDSVANLFLNDTFAYQLRFDKRQDSEGVRINPLNLFTHKDESKFPTYLINKGNNKLSLDFAMVPYKKGACEFYNLRNLVATVSDESSIELPRGIHWIEMPNLSYVASGTYPYSIYPDLHDTAIILTHKSAATIESALQMAYYLGQNIGYPSFRLSVSSDLEANKDKHIILIGKYTASFDPLFKNATLKFENNRASKRYVLDREFIEYLNPFDSDRLNKYKQLSDVLESDGMVQNVVVEMFRSPYNDDKSVLTFLSDDTEHLAANITELLKPQAQGLYEGDTLIYDPLKGKIATYEIGNKYFFGDLSLFDRIRFWFSSHPIFFFISTVGLIMVMAIVLRRILLRYKRIHHEDAEA